MREWRTPILTLIYRCTKVCTIVTRGQDNVFGPPPFYKYSYFFCLLSISIIFEFFSVVYDLTDRRKDESTRLMYVSQTDGNNVIHSWKWYIIVFNLQSTFPLYKYRLAYHRYVETGKYFFNPSPFYPKSVIFFYFY